jgi:hypothetical protein
MEMALALLTPDPIMGFFVTVGVDVGVGVDMGCPSDPKDDPDGDAKDAKSSAKE